MTQPQIEPDSEPEFIPLEEEQEPSFGTVDWEDANTEDGTAYVQRMNPPPAGQTTWVPTSAFLLICNVGPGGIGDPTSHIVNAGSTTARSPDAFMVSSVADSTQPYDGSPTAFNGMQGFKVWFYVPSTTSWIIKEWTPTAGEAIGQINLKHRYNAQHGNQITITSVMSAAPQPTTIPGATSDGPQVAPEAPAYMSGVTLNGG